MAVESPSDLSDIAFFSPETLAEPWEVYRRLRDHAPVFQVPGTPLKVVTRYDLAMEVISDPETYSSQSDFVGAASRAASSLPAEDRQALAAIEANGLQPVDTLLTADPPVHTRYRKMVGKLFTAGSVRRMETAVDDTLGKAIDSFIDERGAIDFMHRFSLPVTLEIIADRMGIPDADRSFFYDAATAAAAALRMTAPGRDEMLRRAQLSVDLQKFTTELVEQRRKEPQQDLTTLLAQAQLEQEDGTLRPLHEGETWSILNQFLVAGHETTASAFGWGMLLLCQQPDLQDQIRGSGDHIKSFVEETLRLEAPVQGLPRRVTRDTELGGTPLHEGDVLMVRYGACNRDERQFERPDELDLARKNAGSHLSFGSGTHHCPGAPLSRQELNRGFRMLLERTQNLRLAPDHPPPKAEPSLLLRSLPELWIQFDPRPQESNETRKTAQA